MEKFADEALIEVSAGNGGNGCVAFRREKYVPRGGPSGGDGGRGGDVVFEIRRNLRTLAHLRWQQHFRAENGRDGEGRERHGRNGADIVVPLPPGTLLYDAETGDLVRDFGAAEGRFVFLRGGSGGWGNVHFKSPVNQAPRKSLPGRRGKSRKLRVELQVMADIGLVGFPNAGKSSLLEKFTNARPKIAPYPFTTKIPNLGVLTLGDARNGDDSLDIILADIPGLIEGASGGAGLGIRFLKHISRTRALVFLIDLADDTWRDAFKIVYNELESFSLELAGKRRIVAGTKLDLPGTAERLVELRTLLPGEEVFGISVFSGEGIGELARAVGRLAAADGAEPADGGAATDRAGGGPGRANSGSAGNAV